MLARQAEIQLRGLQPLPAWQGEKQVHRLLVWEDALREREAREARARGGK